MFLVRARALAGVELRPLGYKILLEVLGRGHWQGLAEVPYAFSPRQQGSSKLGARQSAEYLVHLARLALATGQLDTWTWYAFVGLGGAVIDVAAFWLLVRLGGWRPGIALPAAIEIALLSNFTWNQAITFRRPSSTRPDGGKALLATLLRYERVCLLGALFNFLATMVLVARGVGLVPASSIGLIAGGLWNLLFNVPKIWQAWSDPHSSSPAGPVRARDRSPAGSMGKRVNLEQR
jgi:dolichol-phosphate mannosyltransferase